MVSPPFPHPQPLNLAPLSPRIPGSLREVSSVHKTCCRFKSPKAAATGPQQTTFPVCVNLFCFFQIRFLLTDPLHFFCFPFLKLNSRSKEKQRKARGVPLPQRPNVCGLFVLAADRST